MTAEQEPITHAESIKKIAKMIKGIKFAMLSTITLDGHIHSRPMTTQNSTFNGELWFFSTRNAPFRADIDRNPEVNLAYAQPDGNAYVSLCGTAEFVEDHTKAEELWNPMLKAWFPEGISDPNLIMIKVKVHSAQYWDSPSAKVVQLFGMAKSMMTGEQYKTGESCKVNLELN